MGAWGDYAGLLEALGNQGFTVDAQRCVSVRNRKVTCGKCAAACVSGCISVEGRRVSVDPQRCIGCGTCATACPTGAISLNNPSDAEVLEELRAVMAHNGGLAVVACVTAVEPAERMLDLDAVARVACLGRIDEAALAALAAEGAAGVTLVAGDCEQCPHSKGLSAIAAVVAGAKSLAAAWGGCPVKLVRKFPRRCARVASESFDLQRREFLLGMKSLAKTSAQEAARFTVNQKFGFGSGAPEFQRVGEDGTLPHAVPAKRQQLLSSLAAWGSPQDALLEGRLWHRVIIDQERCSGCQMCAVFCPTGALAKHREVDEAAMNAMAKMFRAPGNPRAATAGEAAQEVIYKRHKAPSASSSFATGTLVELRFAPGLCVSCDSCRQLCPKGAIRLEEGVAAPEVLAGYGEPIPLKDVFRDKGGPDAIRNSMSKLIDSPYLWG